MADPTEPTVPLLLTPVERREGISEAMQRAVVDIPELGYDGIEAYATWSRKAGAATVGVVVQAKSLTGAVIAEKTYDDLRVIVAAGLQF